MPFHLSHALFFTRPDEVLLCSACSSTMQLLEGPTCPGCSRPQCSDLCEECKHWRKIYPDFKNQHQALYAYEGLVQELLIRYKYHLDYRLAAIFKGDLIRHLKGQNLVPIPSSPSSFKTRGFHPVHGLLHAAGLPYMDLLIHKGRGKKQSEKTRLERLNSPQAFELSENLDHLDKNQSLILVDDVYTTGRTLYHALELFHSKGFHQVRTLSLARSS